MRRGVYIGAALIGGVLAVALFLRTEDSSPPAPEVAPVVRVDPAPPTLGRNGSGHIRSPGRPPATDGKLQQQTGDLLRSPVGRLAQQRDQVPDSKEVATGARRFEDCVGPSQWSRTAQTGGHGETH